MTEVHPQTIGDLLELRLVRTIASRRLARVTRSIAAGVFPEIGRRGRSLDLSRGSFPELGWERRSQIPMGWVGRESRPTLRFFRPLYRRSTRGSPRFQAKSSRPATRIGSVLRELRVGYLPQVTRQRVLPPGSGKNSPDPIGERDVQSL